MTLSLLGALVAFALWIVLGFVTPIATGWVHLLYAAGTILLARRVLVGAPRFLA